MTTPSWIKHAFVNRLQTLALMIFLGGYLAILGWILWGAVGVFWLIIFGSVLSLLSPSTSPQLVMRLYRARPVFRHEAPELYQVMIELSRRAGLSYLPAPHYIPSKIVNAFAVGTRDKSAIAVTEGLLRSLDWSELVGVLAHEISHIRNNDLRVMGLADIASRFSSIMSMIGQILLLLNLPLIIFSGLHVNWLAVIILIFAPHLSALAQLGLSRVREYDADLNAALLTGDPGGLARALVKMGGTQNSIWREVFLPGSRSPEPSLLRTHPPTEERIRRLLELKESPSVSVYKRPYSGEIDEWSMNGQQPIQAPRWHISGLWH